MSHWAATGSIEEFNAESAVIQEALGIDPSRCLRVVRGPGEKTVLLEDLFSNLKQGLWPTPEDEEHDRLYHWRGVRELHPVFIPMVLWAATIGEKALVEGRRSAAEAIGDALDLVVNVYAKGSYYGYLLDVCGINELSEEFRFSVEMENQRAIRSAQLRRRCPV